MTPTSVCVALGAVLCGPFIPARSIASHLPVRRSLATVSPNDNHRAAGTLANGVLTVALEARTGTWQPEGGTGPTYTVAAFAVVDGPLQTPGPLLRVPAGTEVRATVRNALTVPMWLYGFGVTRGYGGDSVQIAAGATAEVHFRADTPGLSYYAARTSRRPVFARLADDAQLNGVIVVDPPGPVPTDRIFVISNWFTVDPKTVSGLGPNAMLAFNGLGWPNTPRIDLTEGVSVHWRFVNVSALEHPLHLHGAYFRVDAKGDGVRDSAYAPLDQRLAVTELMQPGQTMAMTWSPVHSGNWILHCHFASHISKRELFEADRRMPPPVAVGGVGHAHDDPMQHMAALVIGIRVHPRAAAVAPGPVSQHLRLLVRSRAHVYGDYAGYGFVLGGSAIESHRDSFTTPGPTLELVRGKRVAITIVNQSHEAAAVHWHGIELESFPDGVPGWSGWGGSTLPHVMPGDSLTVRFTPPRSGTFMYHSHANEMQQISSGLYGAIIVRDSAVARPPSDERLLVFSDGGPTLNFFAPSVPVLLNGKARADTIEVPMGRPTRLRMINIRTEATTELRLEQDGQAVSWRVLAKDGASLPVHQVHVQPAVLKSGPGEIHDVELTPSRAGVLALDYFATVGDSTSARRAFIRVVP